jgi:hypothetical protein
MESKTGGINRGMKPVDRIIIINQPLQHDFGGKRFVDTLDWARMAERTSFCLWKIKAERGMRRQVLGMQGYAGPCGLRW